MKAANFWTEDYPRPLDLPTVDLPDRADVVIVGSGYTGLHAAIALRRAGASVAVLEQETIGWGASSRNGGMALTGMKLEMPEVFRRYGPKLGRAFWEWSLASIDHLECTIAEERIDCDFRRTGHILLAAKPKHYAAMVHELEWMQRELDYHDAWLVSKECQQAEVGTAEFYGGLADRRSGAHWWNTHRSRGWRAREAALRSAPVGAWWRRRRYCSPPTAIRLAWRRRFAMASFRSAAISS